MFGLGAPELILIVAVGLLIFGPGKLPEIGASLGRAIRDFRRAVEHKSDGEAVGKEPDGTSAHR